MAAVSKHLRAIPNSTFPIFEFAPHVAGAGAKLAQWASFDGNKSEMQETLSTTWARDSTQVLDSVAPQIVVDAAEEKLRKMYGHCLANGFCLCSPEGRQVAKLGAAYKNAIRPCFAKKAAHSALIADGQIVVRFVAECIGEGDVFVEPDRWYHVGMHYFKPVRSSFFVLEIDTGPRPDAAIEINPIALKAFSV
jgi:hypothetical protein